MPEKPLMCVIKKYSKNKKINLSQLSPIRNKVSTLALIFFKSDAQNIPWKCVRLEWIWTAPTEQHGDVFSRSPLVWSQDHSVLPLSRYQVEFMPSLKLHNGYVDEKTSPQPPPRHSGWNINLGWPVRRSRSPSTGAFATTECSDT